MTHIWASKLHYFWFTWTFVICLEPCHYLNQYWPIINWTLRNIIHLNIIQDSKFFIHEIAFETIFYKIVVILFHTNSVEIHWGENISQIARFTWPTWSPPGSCRPQVGPMNLAIRVHSTNFNMLTLTGISLCMRPANERRRYNVTTSLIGWVHT